MDAEIKTSQDGRKYQILKGEILLNKWQRIVSAITALALTFITAGIALFVKSIREKYAEAYYGRKLVVLNIGVDSLPNDSVNKIDSSNIQPEGENKPIVGEKVSTLPPPEQPLSISTPSTTAPKDLAVDKAIEAQILEFDGKKNQSIRALLPSVPQKGSIKNSHATLKEVPGTIRKPITTDVPPTIPVDTNSQPDVAGTSKLVNSDSTAQPQLDLAKKVDQTVVSNLSAQNTIKKEESPVLKSGLDTIRNQYKDELRKNGAALKGMPEDIKNDKEMVLLAIEQNYYSIALASDRLKKDPQILEAAAKKLLIKCPSMMCHFKENLEAVLLTIESIINAVKEPNPQGLYLPVIDKKMPGFIMCDEGIFILSEKTVLLCDKLLQADLVNNKDLCDYAQCIEQGFQALLNTSGFNEDALIAKFQILVGGIRKWSEKIVPTLIWIGNCLQSIKSNGSPIDNDVYYTSEDDNTLPFIIAKDGEVYLQGMQFARGTFKSIFTCLALFGSEEVIWMSSSDKLRGYDLPINRGNCPALADAQDEENVLKELHALKIPHIQPLYKATVQIGDGVHAPVTYIRIQKRFFESFDLINGKMPGEKFNPVGILRIGIDVALALAELHRNKRVHSDVKPMNILFRKNIKTGEVLEGILTDFGTVVGEGLGLKSLSPLYSPSDYYDDVNNKLTDKTISPSLDSFNLGITLLHYISGSCEMQNKLEGIEFEKARELENKQKQPYDQILKETQEKLRLREIALGKSSDSNDQENANSIKKEGSASVQHTQSSLGEKPLEKENPLQERERAHIKQKGVKYFFKALNPLHMIKNLADTKRFISSNKQMNDREKSMCLEMIDVCQHLTAGLKDEKSGKRNIISCAEAAYLLEEILKKYNKK